MAHDQHQRSSPERVQALLDQLAGQISRLDEEVGALRRNSGSELAAALLAHEVNNILTPGKALAQLALAPAVGRGRGLLWRGGRRARGGGLREALGRLPGGLRPSP